MPRGEELEAGKSNAEELEAIELAWPRIDGARDDPKRQVRLMVDAGLLVRGEDGHLAISDRTAAFVDAYQAREARRPRRAVLRVAHAAAEFPFHHRPQRMGRERIGVRELEGLLAEAERMLRERGLL